MPKLKLAFFGFRHGHVMGLYKSALAHPRVQVVAAVEEDATTAASLRASGAVELTHDRFDDDIFDNIDFDAVAVGDYFSRRGEIAIRALEAGKHVIADKPICTILLELEKIEQVAKSKGRAVGCLLDLRDHGPFITMRRLIRGGAIGTVHTVNVAAQHPLLLGKRPAWYLEPGKQGGTINDIAVHAIDLIPGLTGRRIIECVAARAWNARLPQFPHFQDAAQIMLKLDNGGGVLGDFSYLAADGVAYAAEQYWRVTCHGDGGVMETSYNAKTVSLAKSADASPQSIPAESGDPTGCLDAFLDEIAGSPHDGALTTRDVLSASRQVLHIQQAADEGRSNVAL
ncbi:MAG: Gfo/Idh/MocA family oxidoreductase [Tepidisphaeraceae bacterium]